MTLLLRLVVLITEAEGAESAAKLKAEIEALKSAAAEQVSPYLSSIAICALVSYRSRRSDSHCYADQSFAPTRPSHPHTHKRTHTRAYIHTRIVMAVLPRPPRRKPCKRSIATRRVRSRNSSNNSRFVEDREFVCRGLNSSDVTGRHSANICTIERMCGCVINVGIRP